MSIFLGVNVDHIANIREARQTTYPNLVEAVSLIEKSGADSITLHLREDRRHIQDSDVYALRKSITTKMNFEMAATKEMIDIALKILPQDVCIVPEKREELTTEGGLDVINNKDNLKNLCQQMQEHNITTSLFIDSDFNQIEAAKECGAEVVEIHTGHYANNLESFAKIKQGVEFADSIGLKVNAGHGLTLENTKQIAALPQIYELNIGHSIIARSIFVGLAEAVKEMKNLMLEARGL